MHFLSVLKTVYTHRVHALPGTGRCLSAHHAGVAGMRRGSLGDAVRKRTPASGSHQRLVAFELAKDFRSGLVKFERARWRFSEIDSVNDLTSRARRRLDHILHPYRRQILEFRPVCNGIRNDGSNGARLVITAAVRGIVHVAVDPKDGNDTSRLDDFDGERCCANSPSDLCLNFRKQR